MNPSVDEKLTALLGATYLVAVVSAQLAWRRRERRRLDARGGDPDDPPDEANMPAPGYREDASGQPRPRRYPSLEQDTPTWVTTLVAAGWLVAFLVAAVMGAALGLPGMRSVEADRMMWPALLGGLVVWAGYTALIALVSRRGTEPVIVVVAGAALGLLGFPLLGVMSVHAVNQVRDTSPAEVRVVPVVSRTTHKGRTSVRVDLRPGALPPSSASPRPYDRSGDTLTLRVHRGALGIPWFEPPG